MSNPRERLLSTAGQLFTERGYECVGINEIIKTAEVAKASFYQHFPSKKDLCAAWLQDQSERSLADQRELLDSKGTLKTKLTTQFRSLSCWAEGTCYRACPFSITASMTDAGAESHRIIREYKEATRRFWQGLAREATASPSKARDLGDAWFLLYSGAATEAQNCSELWPIEQARKLAISLASKASMGTF